MRRSALFRRHYAPCYALLRLLHVRGSDRQLRVFNANRDIAEVVEEIAKATEAVPTAV